jgi:hypothetical protein
LCLRGLPGGLLQGSSVHLGWSSDRSSSVSLLYDARNQATVSWLMIRFAFFEDRLMQASLAMTTHLVCRDPQTLNSS